MGKHIRELDGLRAVAVLGVMLFHAHLLPQGSLGVDVFFVLSGYLITGICIPEIERTGGMNFGTFLVRRARRLFPALLLLLVSNAVLAPVFLPDDAASRWFEIAFAATYLMDIAQGIKADGSPLSHTWSLAVEVQFYLVWPGALVLCGRLGRKWAGLVILGLWVACTVGRSIWLATGHSADAAYFMPPWHATGLMLGSALALIPVPKIPALPMFAALIALMCVTKTDQTFSYAIAAAELVTAALITNPPKALAWPPWVWLGQISYGVYLWHIPVWHALQGTEPLLAAVAMTAVSIGLAAASYYGVERWILRPRVQPLETEQKGWAAKVTTPP